MGRKKALTREQLTSPPELKRVELEEVGGGGVVYVRPLPVSLGFAIWGRNGDEPEDQTFEKMLPDMAIHAVVDENGHRILDDEDREWVSGWPLGDARRVYAAIMEKSAMGGEVEETEGN